MPCNIWYAQKHVWRETSSSISNVEYVLETLLDMKFPMGKPTGGVVFDMDISIENNAISWSTLHRDWSMRNWTGSKFDQ